LRSQANNFLLKVAYSSPGSHTSFHRPALIAMEINCCSKKLVDRDVEAIFNLCAKKVPSPDIALINLAHNQIHAKGTAAVARFLACSGKVKKLDMRSNHIGNEGLAHLVDALEADTALTDLDLRRNELDDRCVDHLASLLESNQAIVNLDLRNNKLTAAGIDRVTAAVASSGCQTEINVEWLGDEACRERLAAALAKNRETLMVLTLMWDPPIAGKLLMRCCSIGGSEVASEQVLLSDTLASLNSALAKSLRISPQRLRLILPNAQILEDETGTATLQQLLSL